MNWRGTDLKWKNIRKKVEFLKSAHKTCDDLIDWVSINSTKPPFNPIEQGPNELRAMHEFETFTPNFFEKIFRLLREKHLAKLQAAIREAKERDSKDYDEWENLNKLSINILSGDIDTYFQVIAEMKQFDDLLELGSDFEVGADDSQTLQVEFRVKSSEVVPDYALSLTLTGKLSRKNLTKTNYFDLVQDYVCSCAIRVARDSFALLPVKNVIVHALDNVLNTETGYHEDVTILSVVFEKDIMQKLNFSAVDPSDALTNFRYNMKFLKTAGFKAVERIDN